MHVSVVFIAFILYKYTVVCSERIFMNGRFQCIVKYKNNCCFRSCYTWRDLGEKKTEKRNLLTIKVQRMLL